MKRLFIISILLIPFLTNAQLLNGSFEYDGGPPSTDHWQNTCDDPVSYSDAAPDWDLWCIQKQYGNTQSCFPSYVYQTIPDMNDGEIWTASGWARTDSMYVGTLIGIFLAKKDASTAIELFDSDLTSDPTWTYLSVTDTIHLNAGDTGAVVLSAGLVGGPMFGYAYFDGIELVNNSTVGIEEQTTSQLSVFPSPASDELYIGSQEFSNEVDVKIFDLTGKIVLSLEDHRRQNRSTIRLEVETLNTGTYLVQVVDGSRALTARFFKK